MLPPQIQNPTGYYIVDPLPETNDIVDPLPEKAGAELAQLSLACTVIYELTLATLRKSTLIPLSRMNLAFIEIIQRSTDKRRTDEPNH